MISDHNEILLNDNFHLFGATIQKAGNIQISANFQNWVQRKTNKLITSLQVLMSYFKCCLVLYTKRKQTNKSLKYCPGRPHCALCIRRKASLSTDGGGDKANLTEIED